MNNSHSITASLIAPPKTMNQLFACTAAVLAAISSVSAQSRYAVTDLGTLPGTTTSIARGLNDRGDVVGSCSGGTSPNEVACVWRNGVLSNLGKLSGGNYSDANAINLSGVVVGDGDTGNWRPQSWVTTPNGLVNIFPNNGGNTHTVGINNSGAICGYYTKSLSGNTASWRGAIWTVDPKDPRKIRMTDLPALPGNDPKFTSAIPFAFNQSGQAAGWAVNDIIGQQASFWNNDAAHSIVQLGAFPGDWSSIAWGISDLGQVVGESHPPAGCRPVLWDNDAAHTPYELPLLPDDNYGTATAINSLGQILGWTATSAPNTSDVGPMHLVVWVDGNVFELESLLDPTSGADWSITSANAINNLGQIAGFGVHNGQTHAFLLTPIAQ